MRPKHWEKNIFELIRRTSTDLPNDVESYLKRAYNREQKGSRAHWSLSVIMENIASARENDLPLCQDTGFVTVFLETSTNFKIFPTRKVSCSLNCSFIKLARSVLRVLFFSK